MVITLLGGSGQDDVIAWDEQYNIDYAVIADQTYIGSAWEGDNGIPSNSLVAPGGEITVLDGDVTKESIEALLPQ